MFISCNTEDYNQTYDPESYNAIDIGLSVKWADKNLGAARPDLGGNFFAWGETEAKPDNMFMWSGYKWSNGDENNLTKYCNYRLYGTVDGKTELETADDVAHKRLGGKWRLPTRSEIDELIYTKKYSSDYKWEEKGNGWLITYLVNGNSIFIPDTGCRIATHIEGEEAWTITSIGSFYWSSTLSWEQPSYAWCFCIIDGSVLSDVYFRCYGFQVRPVYED